MLSVPAAGDRLQAELEGKRVPACSEGDVLETGNLANSHQLTPVSIFKRAHLQGPQKIAGCSYLSAQPTSEPAVKGLLRRKSLWRL